MLYLILPAFNEEKDIAALLDRVEAVMRARGCPYQVVVVNDGSTDATARAAREASARLPVDLIEHDRNRGLGQALLTGLTHAAGLAGDEDVVVVMDADNTHDPALMPELAEKIQRGKDVVIASRYAPGGREIGLSTLRRLTSLGASVLLRLFFPIPGARDFTCGYRAYRGEMLRKAFAVYGPELIHEHGFTCMAELLIKLYKLGARVGEAPLILRYDLKSGPSKMKVGRTIARYLVLIVKGVTQPVPHPALLEKRVAG